MNILASPGGPIEHPYDYQSEALEQIREARERGLPRVTIEMATGLGKMVVAGFAVKDGIENLNALERTLFVSHQQLILAHARETFTEILPEWVSHGNLYGTNNELDAQITYASYHKLARTTGDSKRYQSLRRLTFPVGIGDECHHAAAPTFRAIHDYYDPDIFINFSATPYRRDGRDTLEVTGPIIYRKTLPEALAEGLLTPVRYKLYSDELLSKGSISHGLENITLAHLNREIFIPRRDEEIVEIIKDELKEIAEPRGLIFCSSIEHADRTAELLNKSISERVVALHSKLKQSDQKTYDNYTEGFKTGAIPLATVVDQFNEGVDFPDLNFLVFLRSTSSERIFLQQVGRGLRRYEGKDFVTVIDLAGGFDHINVFLNLYDAVQAAKPNQIEPVDLHPPIDFKFSAEARDILDLATTARKRVMQKQAELEPWRQLEIPEKHTIRIESVDDQIKELELSPLQTFVIKKIWEDPSGAAISRYIREAHKFLFKKATTLRKVYAELRPLEEQGVLSQVKFQGGGRGDYNWRLTEPAIESLLKLEQYRSDYAESMEYAHNIIRPYFEIAETEDFPNLGQIILGDPRHDPIHLNKWLKTVRIKRPLNKNEIEKSDITTSELDDLWHRRKAIRYGENDASHFYSAEYVIGPDKAQLVRTVSQVHGGGGGIAIRRTIMPGEIKKLADSLRDKIVSPL